MSRVVLGKERISRLAELLKKADLPKPTELPIKSDLASTQLLNAYFNLIVPLCHQTTPIGGVMLEGDVDGKHRVGWDYLSQRLFKETKANPIIAFPGFLSNVNEKKLQTLFSESTWKNADLSERTKLLNGLGKYLIANGCRTAEDLFTFCEDRIRKEDGTGIIDRIKETEVYSDPAEKKIRFALSLIHGGLYDFEDPEKLGSIVDYHETRLHLRLGNVIVNDKALETALRDFKPVESVDDVVIRSKVGEAIEELSRQTGCSLNQLHWYLWNAARNSCKRKNPSCNNDKGQESRPEEYRAKSLFKEHSSGCEFKELCPSCNDQHPLNDTLVPNGHYH